MTGDDVAHYLMENPGFFEEYHELLAHLVVPHPHGGRTISITERQILTLREKSRQLESKLVELVRYGEENDAISEKVHSLALAMAATNQADVIFGVIRNHLLEDFQVPHVVMRFWGGDNATDSLAFSGVEESMRVCATDLKYPYCGPSAGLEAADWFGEAATHIQSLALIPLRRRLGDSEAMGLLALGSEAPERFYAEMGIVFLERIGELIVANVLRAQE